MAEGTNKRNVSMTIDELKDTFQYGMHGCGYYKGAYHANALEPLCYWKRKGVKVMEIDIAKTDDGKFVALAHLMNAHYLGLLDVKIPDDNTPLTEQWFMGQRLCKRTTGRGLTPMNLAMIVDKMEEDKNLFIMFDLWRMWNERDNNVFANDLKNLFQSEELINRCIIEVYNKEMLRGIKAGCSQLNIMYCVHGSSAPEFDEKVTPKVLKELGIDVISFPWTCVKEHPGEIEQYHDEGFTIFSLFKDNRYSRQMKKVGVNVNLCDILYLPSNAISIISQRTISKLQFEIKKFFRL